MADLLNKLRDSARRNTCMDCGGKLAPATECPMCGGDDPYTADWWFCPACEMCCGC